MQKNTKGFIALMSVIIISAVLLGLVATANLTGYFSRFNSLDSEYKRVAVGLAESCNNIALLRLAQNYAYNPTDDIVQVGVGTCHIQSITPITSTGTQKLAEIQTWASYNGAFSNLTLTATVQNPLITQPGQASVTVIVQTLNVNGGTKQPGDFTVTVNGTNVSQPTFSGAGGAGTTVLISPGSFSVTEAAVGGYSTAYQNTGTPYVCALSNALAGQSYVCVISNSDQPTTARLTVIANVTNNNGGSLSPANVSMSVLAPGTTTPTTVTSGQTLLNVVPGSYTVNASALPGYGMSAWGGDCAASGAIALTAGQSKTCIIAYDDNAPPTPSCANTVVMMDRTGSMTSGDLSNEKFAANSLLGLYGALTPVPQVAFGVFGDKSDDNGIAPAIIIGHFTSIYSTLVSALNTWLANSSGDTNLESAVTTSQTEINTLNNGLKNVLVLISDGEANTATSQTVASTGLQSPTNQAQNGSGDSWTNAAGAYSGATPASDTGGHHEQYYDFGSGNFLFGGMNIPNGSGIVGIQVSAQAVSATTPVAGNSLNLAPTSASLTMWTPNTGTAVSAVSQADATDATYVSAPLQAEDYTVAGAAVPAGATITSVTLNVVAKETAGTSGSITLMADNGTTQIYDSGHNLSSSYVDYTWSVPTMPSGAAWTVAEVNSWTTKFGFLNTSDQGSIPRVTQAYVSVAYTLQGSVTLAPSAVGNFNSWSLGAGSNVTSAVATNDGNSSYITETTTGQAETYAFPGAGIPAGASVTSVVLNAWAANSGSGNSEVTLRAERGTAGNLHDDDGGHTVSSTSYAQISRTMTTNPVTNAAWSVTELNSGSTNRFGVVRTNSFGENATPRVTQISLMVNYSSSGASANLAPVSSSLNTWAPNTGTAVSAVAANDADTTYMSAPLQAEDYTLAGAAVPAGATITSVTLHAIAREAIGTQGSITLMADNGTTQIYDNGHQLTSSYVNYSWSVPTMPSGAAWTVAEVNNWTTKFGFLNTSDQGSIPRVTQAYVVVGYTTTSGGAGSCQLGVEVSKNGGTFVPTGGQATTTINGTSSTYTFGGPTSLWGTTWSNSNFNYGLLNGGDSDFRLRIQDIGCGVNTTKVSNLGLNIYYSTGADPTQAAINAATAAKAAGTTIFAVRYSTDNNAAGIALLQNIASPDVPIAAIASAALSGAKRASNVVTITTAATSSIFAGQTVEISGVANSSFNGTFVVASAPSATAFTYAQTGTSATSGGGSIAYPHYFTSPTNASQMAGVFDSIGGIVCPLINNPPPPGAPTTATVLVITHAINDNGGTESANNFTISVPGGTPSGSAGAEAPGTTYVVPPGSYSVTENADSNYVESLGTQCAGTIAAGETATCTIINDDNPPPSTPPPPPPPPPPNINIGSWQENP